ncbi:hypothetical protein KSW27_01245 [Holdemanella biformis]|uniref:hypothetical protein n=1 Tax=Holdemanella biformis TaxID=1735 RepID=UPI001C25D380|nr:hypothetical protein [Holdemanella biformis]MBU9894879.1 hypothetical protein [Holdemanella biformis]MBV3415921.1 hypothetical protein [Holdemanella biformis]
MWIRSQSKRLLINIDVISVHNECDYYLVRGAGYELGAYYSKEKALKVLDEIQEAIEDTDYYRIDNIGHGTYALANGVQVYQMPQDDEVEV